MATIRHYKYVYRRERNLWVVPLLRQLGTNCFQRSVEVNRVLLWRVKYHWTHVYFQLIVFSHASHDSTIAPCSSMAVA
jgi:hypothetical protein